MPFPTTNASKELPDINQILSSCGQAPVTTLDTTNPDVAIAYDTLLEVNREVQAEGWTFNKENHVEFPTDDSGYINIQKLNPIGRLAGDNYTRVNDTLVIKRKIKPD